MRVWRRTVGAASGLWLALLPIAAAAQEEAGRTVERSDDWAQVMILTLAAIIGVMLVATLGYLYRARRHLVWDFQAEESHADSHH